MTFDASRLVNASVRNLAPYKVGASLNAISQAYNIPAQQIIKLGSNENPYGMSPLSAKAAQDALTKASRYPDNRALVEAVARHHDVDPDQVILGNGSTEVIDIIARTFLNPKVAAVSSQYAFAMFATMTNLYGAKNIVAPAAQYAHDLDAMLANVTPNTRVIWIANPNNPTGTFVPYSQIKHFLDKLPPNIMAVLDEAYYDYLAPDLRQDAAKWISAHPNLILLRTFSKIYGLAGLRVGYGIADKHVASLLNRAKQPLNINSAGLAAAAAALEDQAFAERCRERNHQAISQLQAGLDKLGLAHLPAHGNFITARFEAADQVNEALLRQGIIVRPLTGGLADWLRISVGTTADTDRFLVALQKIVASSLHS